MTVVGNTLAGQDVSFKAAFDDAIVDLKLPDYFEGSYGIVLFYPLDFTFVCPTELTAFSDRYDEFEALGAKIIGVSTDSEYTHLRWTQTPRNEGGVGQLQYPLVSDMSGKFANAFGVLTPEHVALRGLFILDPDLNVKHCTINALPLGRNVDEALRVLAAVKKTYEDPDCGCPANWKPGDKTITPTPEGSKEFFAALD